MVEKDARKVAGGRAGRPAGRAKKIGNFYLFARYMYRDNQFAGTKKLGASGLVVKFNVAIVEPRVRFSAGACPTFLPPRVAHLAPGGLVFWSWKVLGWVWEGWWVG